MPVTVDRPLGGYHPEHKDMRYQLNSGYIEGIHGVRRRGTGYLCIRCKGVGR